MRPTAQIFLYAFFDKGDILAEFAVEDFTP